ncbi:CpsD/CapB family tyrosine-protein kinase [Butyrivibrio sp. VCD2006]|uniref:CpsD/CapB family tyrosine-protein kinase n=1 Tax=Butyrivibrio sp. VCD2006 TaxID=1280664 RepID=UPI00041B63CB|nr:CpsD/CapB family tyrosine-protein kinase [Butyrivibrio sp. VCD2006]
MQKLTIKNNPELPYAVEEALNRLRINISFLGKDIKKIMVVSTNPNEGKSFVAMQLWRQMAEAGTKSILIDADLRKSIMTEKYGMSLESGEKINGTSYVLANDIPFSNSLFHTDIADGDILPNSDNVVNPSMLLENQRFEELLDYTKDNYRYTFIDSPPLDLVSDGERIGSLCDGAILVVRGGVTSKSMVKHSVMQLERAGCPLLGIILNRVEGSKGGYYYKKYGGKYYGGHYGKYYSGDSYYYGKKKA